MALSFDKVTSLAATMEELAMVAATKRILAMDFIVVVVVQCIEYNVLGNSEMGVGLPVSFYLAKSKSPKKRKARIMIQVTFIYLFVTYVIFPKSFTNLAYEQIRNFVRAVRKLLKT